MKNNKTMLALGLLLGVGAHTAVSAGVGMVKEVPVAWAGQPVANETTVPYTSGMEQPVGELAPYTDDYPMGDYHRESRRKLTAQETAELKTLKAKQKNLETEFNVTFKERAARLNVRFNPVITAAQSEALAALAEHSQVKMKAAMKKGLDVNAPINGYTLLMHAGDDLEMIKCLVEECGADVNEAVWQPHWGHYVTALDCCDWQLQRGEAAKIQKQASDYLKNKGAKFAGKLGFWSDYNGDYVASSEDVAIQKEQQILSELENVQNQVWQLAGEEPYRGGIWGMEPRGGEMPTSVFSVDFNNLPGWLSKRFGINEKDVVSVLDALKPLFGNRAFMRLDRWQQHQIFRYILEVSFRANDTKKYAPTK